MIRKLLFLAIFFTFLFLSLPKNANALTCGTTPNTWTCSNSKCLPNSNNCAVTANGTSQPASCDTGYPNSTWYANGTCGDAGPAGSHTGGCHYNNPSHNAGACGYTGSPPAPPPGPGGDTCSPSGASCLPASPETINCPATPLTCGTGVYKGDVCCVPTDTCTKNGGSCLTASPETASCPTTIFTCGTTGPNAGKVCCMPVGGGGPPPVPPATKTCVVCSSGYTYDSVSNSCFKTDNAGVTTADPGQTTADCGDKALCYPGCGCSPCSTNYPYKTTTGRLPCGTTGQCNTAIGLVNTDVTSIIKTILGVILSISGGIAILLIIISAYRLMVSQGNPEGIQNAREQLTAAIVGLLFIIFAVTILWFIGYNVLGLPGFNP